MPKIERLSWLAPLGEGKGITLSNDPDADLFLAKDPNALMLGVLLDSQFATRQAFASPYRLWQRLGHLHMATIAGEDPAIFTEVFRVKPALHRFPAKFASLTQVLARVIHENYGGDAARIWRESSTPDDLGTRIMALPAFGVEKTNWTVGMLGTLGLLPFEGWEEFQATPPKKPAKRPAPQVASAE
jgi:uncharacterized HhH-GPD family protein